MDRLVKLTGDTSVIDRAIVIHEGRDDLGRGKEADSQTTGRVGCGIIEAID
ncbi:MAG: superoxide dismutase family protein [Spirulina sp.]